MNTRSSAIATKVTSVSKRADCFDSARFTSPNTSSATHAARVPFTHGIST